MLLYVVVNFIISPVLLLIKIENIHVLKTHAPNNLLYILITMAIRYSSNTESESETETDSEVETITHFEKVKNSVVDQIRKIVDTLQNIAHLEYKYGASSFEVVIFEGNQMRNSTIWKVNAIIDKFDPTIVCDSVNLENNSDHKKYNVVVGDIIDKQITMFTNYQDAIQHNLIYLWYGEGRDRTLKFAFTKNTSIYYSTKYEGEYVGGQKTGTWKSCTHEQQITSMGQYMNNRKVGLWYECNEYPSAGVYIDGEKYGKWTTFYAHCEKKITKDDYFYKCNSCTKTIVADKIESYDYCPLCYYCKYCDSELPLVKIYKDSNEVNRLKQIKEGQFWLKYQPKVIQCFKFNEITNKIFNVGEYISYHTNGKIAQSVTFNEYGQKTGTETYRDENGDIVRIHTYIDGALEGYSMFETNGYTYKGSFAQNRKNGIWESFYDSKCTEKHSFIEWTNGLQTGNYVDYYGNGHKWREGKKHNSQIVDFWSFYHSDGTLSSCGNFESYDEFLARKVLSKSDNISVKQKGIWKYYRNKKDDIKVRDPKCYWKIDETERIENFDNGRGSYFETNEDTYIFIMTNNTLHYGMN